MEGEEGGEEGGGAGGGGDVFGGDGGEVVHDGVDADGGAGPAEAVEEVDWHDGCWLFAVIVIVSSFWAGGEKGVESSVGGMNVELFYIFSNPLSTSWSSSEYVGSR